VGTNTPAFIGHAVNLYPNPGAEILFVELTDFSEAEAHITIYASDGHHIPEEMHWTRQGVSKWQSDVSALLPGIYFVQVSAGDQFAIYKWIKS
jgi:hypothetical protein